MQIILLAIIGLAFIMDDAEKLSPIIFILAFAIVQVISIIIHLAAGPQAWKKTGWRKFHLIGTVLVLAAIGVALIQDSVGRTGDKDNKYSMPGLETLVYATIPAILLALFYSVITGLEWRRIKKAD